MNQQTPENALYEGRRNMLSMAVFYLKIIPILVAVLGYEFYRAKSGQGVSLLIVIGLPIGLLIDLLCVGFVRRLSTKYKLTETTVFSKTGGGSKACSAVRLHEVEEIQLVQSRLEAKLNVGTIVFMGGDPGSVPTKFVGVGNPQRVLKIAQLALATARRRAPVEHANRQLAQA